MFGSAFSRLSKSFDAVDILKDTEYVKNEDLFLAIARGRAGIDQLETALKFLQEFDAKIRNFFHDISRYHQSDANVGRQLELLAKVRLKMDKSKIKQLMQNQNGEDVLLAMLSRGVSSETELLIEGHKQESQRISLLNSETKVANELLRNIAEQKAIVEQIAGECKAGQMNPNPRLLSLRKSGYDLFFTLTSTEKNVKLLEDSERKKLDEIVLYRRNMRAQMQAKVRTVMRAGTLATLYFGLHFYLQLFSPAPPGHSLPENRGKIESALGRDLGTSFITGLRELGISDGEIAQFERRAAIEDAEAAQKCINSTIESTKEMLHARIISELKKKDISFEDIEISREEYDEVLTQIARRNAINAYAEFSATSNSLSLGERVKLFLYNTGGKPTFSTQVEQRVVGTVDDIVRKSTNDLANAVGRVVEAWAKEFRDARIKQGLEDLKSFHLIDALASFSLAIAADPGFIKTCLKLGGLALLITLLSYFKITRRALKFGGSQLYRGFVGTVPDIRMIQRDAEKMAELFEGEKKEKF